MDGLETEKAIETQNKEHPKPDNQKFPTENNTNIGPTPLASLHSESWYSGPIPPPHYLIAYEKILPGIAKQFLEEPHREAEHRRNLQTKMVEEQIKLANKGQNVASMLAAVSITGSFLLIYFGHNIEGLGTLFLSIGAFVSIFIYGRHKSERS